MASLEAVDYRQKSSLLGRQLAAALPTGSKFTLFHVSSTPTKCPAIFAAAPGARPEKTYSENQFLAVAIDTNSTQLSESTSQHIPRRPVLFFAIEVVIYSTASLTTIFVSKADSSGYLHLLKLPKGTPSPLRKIATTFVSFLADQRQRRGVKTVISLFARAQDQYLFPGSIENIGKHVLDDRGLIRWWCRTLEPVLRADPEGVSADERRTIRAHVIVPGLDRYETSALFPASAKLDPPDAKRWIHGDPLRDLSSHPTAPPRCLVPRFPDDPKARYLEELDDELGEASSHSTTESPRRANRAGRWLSVKTLEQFWETMEFRQECSSGRLVGFIWLVMSPSVAEAAAAVDHAVADPFKEVPVARRRAHAGMRRGRQGLGSRLTGPIIPRLPRVKQRRDEPGSTFPEETRFYRWPRSSRGWAVVDEKDYKRVNEFLLHLDFATQDVAVESTQRWAREVAAVTGLSHHDDRWWGERIEGLANLDEAPPTAVDTNGISKRKSQEGSDVVAESGEVNMLSTNLVRKKGKTEAPSEVASPVNTLSAGLVRKKPKTRDT